MTRRQLLSAAAATPAWVSAQPTGPTPLRNMGIAPTAVALRLAAARKSGRPLDLVEYCHSLGMGAVQTRLASNDPAAVRSFRQQLDRYNMRAILSAPLPRTDSDLPTFDNAVKASKEAGATALHAAMTGRRYEQFSTLEAFKSNFEQCQRSIALAEPVLRKHRIRLAIENHKGWRSAEQAAWMQRVASEWVGVAFDFGNNLALCEDPHQTLHTLAPYAIFCHMKEMAVDQYEDGFLLSEVNFGEGLYDTGQMIAVLQKKDPDMIFCLEMITRDPLRVPVYTDGYWKTFDDSYSPLPGRDLAHVLNIVRKNRPRSPLPQIAGLSPEAQVQFEEQNNLKCIAYARQHFSL